MTRTLYSLVVFVLWSSAIGCGPAHSTAGRSPESIGPSSRPSSVRVAGIVLKWIATDKQRNFERVCPLIREAARQRADIVITTECFLDGYAIRDKSIPREAWLKLGEEIPGGEYYRQLCGLAAECRVHLVAGFVERAGQLTYNTAVLIGPDGRLIGRYHKHGLEHELNHNTPGTEFPVFDTPFGKIGLIICADRRNPELVRQLRTNGAELILCPSGGMWGPEKNDHYLQARSRENGIPIVFVHPIEFLVTGPAGEILDRRLIGQEMDVVPAEIDSAADAPQVAMFDLPLP
jgi:predicted amidohydrolase